jgi:NADPH2:quinone reductase
MRAVIVREHGPAGSHRVEEVPDPVPGPGEVVVELRAIGVNYPDLLVTEGKYQLLPPRPFSPGKEGAGVVAALGPGVRGLDIGERVSLQTEYGAYAQRIAVRSATVYPMPASIGFEDAAALGLTYQTAHFALRERASLVRGESVLVTGASGGVGLAAVELAKAMGARVLAGVTSAEKGRLALAHGADAVVDLAAENLRDSLREQIARETGGGVDVVIDNVGGDVFAGALRALAWRGRLVVVGFASNRIPEMRANYLLVKNIAVTGLQWSDYRERRPEWVAQVQKELFGLWEAGSLRPHISARYPLERFAEALERFRRRDVTGKMLLLPTG